MTSDDAQALLIELRPRASRGDNSRIALVVTVGVTALEIGVFTMLAVFLPPLRVFVVAWALLITGFLVYGLPRFRRVRRGQQQHTALWLTDSQLGFTDWRGVTVSCPRGEVNSAFRLLITIGRQSRDVLAFLDAGGKVLLSAPLGLWDVQALDDLTSRMGIGLAHRKFINSEDELTRNAPGVPSPRLNRKVFLLTYVGVLAVVLAAVLWAVVLAHR